MILNSIKGSFITPGGNCAGVSISQLSYFDQVIGKTNLQNVRHLNGFFNGHDATIWQDDNLAFRMVSTIQHDYEMEAAIRPPDSNKNLPSEISSVLHNDKTVFNAFAFAMMITGQPQLIGVNGHDDQTKKTVVNQRNGTNRAIKTIHSRQMARAPGEVVN